MRVIFAAPRPFWLLLTVVYYGQCYKFTRTENGEEARCIAVFLADKPFWVLQKRLDKVTKL